METETTKLSGYDLWHQKLKSARFICAPMVDASELAFRTLVRRYSVELAYTPMFHATNFVKDRKYRAENLTTNDQDRPLVVQVSFTRKSKKSANYLF